MEKDIKPGVSIVMPCYNCEKKLVEAVESCFTQDLVDFEIIMVDDGSKDGTRAVMESLAKKHKEIRLIFHEKNKGGGAARNTGIKAAVNPIIYCLDGDDITAPDTIGRMAAFINEKHIDGTAFYERRFFRDKNHANYSSQYNKVLDRPIIFEDLFNDSDVLINNFVYTKDAYERTGGYPEHHGFDTQTFEILFFATGNTLWICPDTAFYHRQAQKGHKSYFEREYEKGLFSMNTFLSLEPALELLDDSVIDLCVHFDILSKNKFGAGENLLDALKMHGKAKKPFLARGTRSARAATFIKASKALLNGQYAESLAAIEESIKAYRSITPLLFVTMVRVLVSMKGVEDRKRESETAKWLAEHDLLIKRKMRWTSPLISRIYSALRSLIPKEHE